MLVNIIFKFPDTQCMGFVYLVNFMVNVGKYIPYIECVGLGYAWRFKHQQPPINCRMIIIHGRPLSAVQVKWFNAPRPSHTPFKQKKGWFDLAFSADSGDMSFDWWICSVFFVSEPSDYWTWTLHWWVFAGVTFHWRVGWWWSTWNGEIVEFVVVMRAKKFHTKWSNWLNTVLKVISL